LKEKIKMRSTSTSSNWWRRQKQKRETNIKYNRLAKNHQGFISTQIYNIHPPVILHFFTPIFPTSFVLRYYVS
jgi:hypothetical protein